MMCHLSETVVCWAYLTCLCQMLLSKLLCVLVHTEHSLCDMLFSKDSCVLVHTDLFPVTSAENAFAENGVMLCCAG